MLYPLIIVPLWFATGYLGWLNGDSFFRRSFGGNARDVLWAVPLLGPFNLVTFVMWGNNIRWGGAAK